MKLLTSTWIVSILLSSPTYAQATLPASYNTSNAPVADLGYVKYAGYTNQTAGLNYFRGLQYAAPPTGELRWRKPVPIESSNKFYGQTINASQIAPACYQSIPLSLFSTLSPINATPQGQSENCLVLDVISPTNPVSNSLPVIIMIHGGGYTVGAAGTYPGDAMVNASSGQIIFVQIQYRLGIFGFLGGSQIAGDGDLNAGLLDQRAALEWVQRNIRAFGGDPARVTIWGGSAGGSSVTYQLAAGGGYDNPPFSAAIAEYPWWQPLMNTSSQDTQFLTALQLANCTSIQCLRSLPAEYVGTLGQRVQNVTAGDPGVGYGVFGFGPVVDGKFVQELPDIAFKLGHFYDVPLLIDHDAYEGWIFSNRSVTTMTEQTEDAMDLFPYGGPAFFSRLYQLYPRSDFNSTFVQRQTWFGDFIISCPTYLIASRAVDTNTNRTAVFKMTFAAGTQLHGATVPFLTSSTTGFPDANNHTLAEIMASYWISFAVAHDPNPLRSSNAPYWPSYYSGSNGTAAMGDAVGFTVNSVTYNSISPVVDPDASERCEFFGNNGFVVRN